MECTVKLSLVRDLVVAIHRWAAFRSVGLRRVVMAVSHEITHEIMCHLAVGSNAEMFYPPKMPQQQRNGNGTSFQRVPVENPFNADVAPVADPFFQPLLAVVGRCWFNGRCWKCNGFIDLLNLRLNLFNYNGFATGFPLQPVGHPLRQQRAPFLMTNAVEQLILALGTGGTGD